MLIFIWCPFCPRVTTVAYKRPQSFGKKCTWQLHLNTHAPLTQQSQSGLTMPRSRHSVRTNQETNSHTTHQGILSQSFQLAEPLWTDPSLRSGISLRKLISTEKKKKKNRQGMNCRTFSKMLACEEKATTTTTVQSVLFCGLNFFTLCLPGMSISL